MVRLTPLERLSVERAAALIDEKATVWARRQLVARANRLIRRAQRELLQEA